MTMIALKEIELELKRVQLAAFDLELQILRKEEEIKRAKDHILIQMKKEDELKKRIQEMNKVV